jgi:DNA-binding response OmpR family regulator
MKILLVEDEPRLNSFICKGLEQQGYAVDAVSTGSEALNLAATERYDLVILDVMLPGISGFEVLENSETV